MKTFFDLRICCCLILMGACGSSLWAGDPAGWAPQDALIFLGTPNCERLCDQVGKISACRLVHEDEFARVVPLERKLHALLEKAAKQIGLSPDDLKIKPQGPAALIVAPDSNIRPGTMIARAAFAADWGSNTDAMHKLFEHIVSAAEQRGATRTTEEFLGVEITTLAPANPQAETRPADEQAASAATQPAAATGKDALHKQPVTLAAMGSVSVVGSDIGIVRDTLQRIKGSSDKSLARSEDYQAVRQCKPLGELTLFVNIPRLIAVGLRSASADVVKGVEASGVKALRPLVATAAFAPEEHRALEIRAFLPISKPTHGLAQMLTDHVNNKTLGGEHPFPFPFPKESVLCGWSNYQFQHFIDDIFNILARVNPARAAEARQSLEIPLSQDEVLDLESVFGSLASPQVTYLSLSEPYERSDVALVYAISHTDREMVSKLFTFLAPYCPRREVAGETIYDIAIPFSFGGSLALTNKQLAIGNTPGIEQLLRSKQAKQEESLASDAQFRRTLKGAPQEAWQLLYIDGRKFFKAAMYLNKKARAELAPGEQPPPFFSFDITDNLLHYMSGIPFHELEKPESILAYAPSLLYTVSAQPKGLQFYINLTEPGGGQQANREEQR